MGFSCKGFQQKQWLVSNDILSYKPENILWAFSSTPWCGIQSHLKPVINARCIGFTYIFKLWKKLSGPRKNEHPPFAIHYSCQAAINRGPTICRCTILILFGNPHSSCNSAKHNVCPRNVDMKDTDDLSNIAQSITH